MISSVIFICCGIIGGLLTALLGIGGGILYVSIYSTLIPELNPVQIITFSLISIAITSIITAIQNKNPITKEQIIIGFTAAISIIITKDILEDIEFNNTMFSLVLLVAIGYMISRKLIKQKKTQIGIPYPIVGIISGVISSLTGLGGGIVLNPLLDKAEISEKILVERIINIIAISTGIFALSTIIRTINIDANNIGVIHSHYSSIILISIGTILSKVKAKKISNHIKDKVRIRIFLIVIILLTINTLIQLLW